VKRDEFKSALLERTAKTLAIHTPSLSKKAAADIAIVVVLNVKAVVKHLHGSASSSTASEFRDMTRLYLQNRLNRPRMHTDAR
jgi:hypothetical protein